MTQNTWTKLHIGQKHATNSHVQFVNRIRKEKLLTNMNAVNVKWCMQRIWNEHVQWNDIILLNSLFTHISSLSPLLRAFFAMSWKASSTLIPSFAEVSKYGIFPFEAHQARAFFSETCSIRSTFFLSTWEKLVSFHRSKKLWLNLNGSKRYQPLYYSLHPRRSCFQ